MDLHKLKIDHPLFQACYSHMNGAETLIAVFRFQEWIRPTKEATVAFNKLATLMFEKTLSADRSLIRHWGGTIALTPLVSKLQFRKGVLSRMGGTKNRVVAGTDLIAEMSSAVEQAGGTLTGRWDNNSTEGQGYSIEFVLGTKLTQVTHVDEQTMSDKSL